uniref:SH3 domain-containing protein n=2 Tax=Sar TaxID=2698737 RepID=A0A7S3PEW8_9STRA|mmetsp:Transcript_16146/g.20693  ORF Transcript_16146/g.20693 Transcript_16146/m.20693 type:complete len:429 (-) Transcript_16146:1195-2481(-)|eukprot:CAMPEP_0204864814 /NCGR_PEP_ID=MMETSP1348-20121228/4338_1 /ASSEMBLY_ACC=CAM_ASM_000700 /TAXON_ID=215587 /ORGANISM="Aplanochytrium stocchinoi, Strain GSBS06" /LENGTH=428 /DNA_ID=CAMNT_0052015575 /DNA_START=310 /DNA_END=1596 /DNA_ORIENTATION=-
MVGTTLEGSVERAEKMLRKMADPKYVKADKLIPETLLRGAEGIAFITIFKAGLFFIGGNVGGGCMIAKVKDANAPGGWRWSGPSAITCGGLGGGFIFGGEKISSIIILNTRSAVRAFMGKGQVTFGGNVSLAVGPVGRDIEAHVGVSNNKEIVAAYSYSRAQGAYIGGTLEGAFLGTRDSENHKFYGAKVTAQQILSGDVPTPFKAQGLVNKLDSLCRKTKTLNGSSIQSIPETIDTHSNSGTKAPHSFQNQYSTSSGHSTNNLSQQSNSKESAAATLTGYAYGNTGATNGSLPPGWQQYFNDQGKPYYVNSQTNTTQWDMPTATTATISRVPPPKVPSSSARPAVPTVRPAIPSRPSARPAPPVLVPIPRKEMAEAIYDYTATRPDELTFLKQSRFEILDKSSPNWWKAKGPDGKVGMIPANYIKPL